MALDEYIPPQHQAVVPAIPAPSGTLHVGDGAFRPLLFALPPPLSTEVDECNQDISPIDPPDSSVVRCPVIRLEIVVEDPVEHRREVQRWAGRVIPEVLRNKRVSGVRNRCEFLRN
jgi:hypothetical protein